MSRSNRNRKNRNKNKNRNQNQNSGISKKDLSEDRDVEIGSSDNDSVSDEAFIDRAELEDKEVVNDKEDIKPPLIDKDKDSSFKNIKVFFLNDVNEYIESFETILSLSREYSRLNVVIKSSEEPKTQKLPSNIHIYTGEIWYNIHKGRELEGFYSEK